MVPCASGDLGSAKEVTSHERAVFVVDDDASVRRALVRLIRSSGYHTEAFASAAAYLERAAFKLPDCLILDVRMPDTNGLELQQRIRNTPLEVPVVLITGHGDENVRRQGLELGVVAVLFKPLQEAQLLEAIARAIAGGSAPEKGP